MQIIDYNKVKKGDCFLLKISSKKYTQYKNMFLVLVVVDKRIDDNFNKKIIIRIKLIKENLDKRYTRELLNDAIFVCTKMTWLEERFFPIDASKSLNDHLAEINSKPVFPNEFGMLFQYEYTIIISNKNCAFSNRLEYIGNFSIDLPSLAFISPRYTNTPFAFINHIVVEDFINFILTNYEDFNLRKSSLFDKNKANKEREFWMRLLYTLPFGKMVVQEMKKRNLSIPLEKDSLTCVLPKNNK